jgi:hypothetical protein
MCWVVVLVGGEMFEIVAWCYIIMLACFLKQWVELRAKK